MVSGWGFLPYWHPVHTSTASTCSWNQRIADCKALKKEHDTNGYPCLLPTKWVANLSAQQWLADIFARAFPACSIRVNTVTRQKCPEWISWNTTRLSWSNTELHIKISLNHWTMNAHGSQNWVLNSMLSPHSQKWPVPCDQGKAPRSWPSLIAPGCQEAEGRGAPKAQGEQNTLFFPRISGQCSWMFHCSLGWWTLFCDLSSIVLGQKSCSWLAARPNVLCSMSLFFWLNIQILSSQHRNS